LGEILGQLNAKRGEILGIEVRPVICKLRMPWYLWLKCLDMRLIYVRQRKDEGCLLWNLIIMPKSQKVLQRRLSGINTKHLIYCHIRKKINFKESNYGKAKV